MINKLIIDGVNTTLTEESPMPYTYTFSQAKVHTVKYALDDTQELCAYAFQGCKNLTSITIPSSLTMIKRGAFKNCSSLPKITIPSSINYIGQEVFDGCDKLKEINLEHTSASQISTYCTFSDNTIIYVPDNYKYVPVAFDDLDQSGSTKYYTRTDWNQYEPVSDVSFCDADGSYFRNQWDAQGDNDHVLEQKDRVPIDTIEFEFDTYTMNQTGIEYRIGYSFLPTNETNHHVYWTVGNENVCTVVDQEPGYVIIKAASTTTATVVRTTLTAHAESGATKVGNLILRNASAVQTTAEPTVVTTTTTTLEPGTTVITAPDTVTITLGQPYALEYTCTCDDADVECEVSVDSPNIEVDNDFNITAINATGTYNITISASNGSGVYKVITVYVVSDGSSDGSTDGSAE